MDHTKELIAMAQKGDKEARNKLCEENMGLVYKSARRFENRGVEFEDICQIGVIGLIKSINRFELDRSVEFSTYAVAMIIGEIRRFLRDDGMIRVSRTIKENAVKVNSVKTKLNDDLMREPTVQEICIETGLSQEEVIEALESMREIDSIYQTVNKSLDGEKDICLIDAISDGSDFREGVVDRLLLTSLLDELNEREKTIIMLRYFRNLTQAQTAKILDISQVQVSRLEKKILLDMRKKVV